MQGYKAPEKSPWHRKSQVKIALIGAGTLPVMLDMVADMERLCPDVVHMNYVNSMAIVCWALNRASSIRTVGLCHSVRATAGELARDIGVSLNDIHYTCAGINQMALYLKFGRCGEDLYPQHHRVRTEGRVPDTNRVRYDILHWLGYFPTESGEHFSEYVSWFIKRGREDLLDKYNIPLDEYPPAVRSTKRHGGAQDGTHSEMGSQFAKHNQDDGMTSDSSAIKHLLESIYPIRTMLGLDPGDAAN